MKKKLATVLMLATVLALIIAGAAFGSSRATTGTFCSPQAAFRSDMPWGLPSKITFASGPQNVEAAYLYMTNSKGVVTMLTASDFARTGKGSNTWTASVDFDVATGSYWSYLLIKNSAGFCGFKYGTISVSETF